MKRPRRHSASSHNSFSGFTLVELMVSVVLVSVLAALAAVVANSVKLKAQEVSCMNNMKNVGVALHLYTTDHGGRYPETTHTTSHDQAWISSLEDYLGDYDTIRICPADPNRDDRLAAGGTSYVLNSFIFVPEVGPWGELLKPALNRPAAIPQPSRTMLAFVCSDSVGVGPGNDHTHSNLWNGWGALCSDIAPGRFGGNPNDPRAAEGRSNYLYADGSARSIHAGEVKSKIASGINIAAIPGLK